MKVKICGIKTERDLSMAINAGADAVGFITDVPVESPRKISLARASELILKVPVFVTSVLVIMPQNASDAINMIRTAKPSAVQIHNALELSEIKKLRETGIRIIKTIPVEKDADLEMLFDILKALSGTVDAVLLDTAVQGKTGGTGVPHNWEISSKLVLSTGVPVILAGGLNPGNVQEAVRIVRPYAVDTASGVESDGRKDGKKVIDFIRNARDA
ncbi:MAG: phosphoribosylanthranilate isomerase [Candidatus Methanoperedens sp.]|nr:phosphoribosylanthranilate isomerase [Candidatus Methanoperedens sp.]